MTVRFCTSIADGPFSYVEGTVLDLPTPLPRRFLDWLNRGIVAPVRNDRDPLTPAQIETAVARRRQSGRGARARGRREQAAESSDDGP